MGTPQHIGHDLLFLKMRSFAAVAAVGSLAAASPFSGSLPAAATADWLVANISTLPTFIQNADGSYTLSNGRKGAPLCRFVGVE